MTAAAAKAKSNGPDYQVIVSHPHEVRRILPFIETRFRAGRLWIVQVKDPKAPGYVWKALRKADRARLRHYVPGLAEKSRFSLPSIPVNLVQALRTENIQKTVTQLSNFRNRISGSPDNLAAQKWLEAEMTALGYATQTVCHAANACSVVAERKGSTAPQDVLLVMAHFDSVGADFAGADDNATGSAVTLEMARVLKTHANRKTFRFFFTNGEEQGLLGAEHYARQLAQSGQARQLKLAINMDMVGYNQNGIVELETDAEWNALAQWFAQLAEKHTTLKSKITLGAWGSDHVPFLKLGVPTLLTIEDWSTKTPCYHQSCDKPETVNYRYANEIAKLNLSAVLSKDAE